MLEHIQDVVYDTNYVWSLPDWWYPAFSDKKIVQKITVKKKSPLDAVNKLFDSMFGFLFPSLQKKGTQTDTAPKDTKNPKVPLIARKDLKDQVKEILLLPDDQYSEKLLTSELRQYIGEVDKHYSSTIADYKSHISPSYWEVKAAEYALSGIFGKTYYTQSYPSYIDALWTRDIFTFHAKWDMSFFIYPEDDSAIQSMLKQKATQLKAEIKEAVQKGITLDTEIEQQYRDVEMIREKLTTREERYFETGYYVNLYHEDEKALKEESKKFEQKIAWYGIRMKNAVQRMDEWFVTWLPLCQDELGIVRSAVTSSLAGSFPFVANDLVADTGILYGINTQTGWLVIFDRFNAQLENMNSVVLATSGAGKSFTVKLEALRYLLNGIDVIVIDPENEYKALCEKVGGTYINIATNSQQFLNPFDIPAAIEDVEYGPGDLLRSHIMNLIGMIQLLVWQTTPEEEAILDKALQNTYTLRWYSFDAVSYEGKLPPIMGDLMNVLEGMAGWEKVALRLSKYVTGTFGKIFNQTTNIDINNAMTVFSIRDLEEALKTPAMYNVLNFIWTKIRARKKKRLIIVDEAWILLQKEVSANFLFGLTKRARKYGVGISTISQDIEDFIRSPYGKPIISNSALQILLKQSTTSIKSLNQLLWLSAAEQQRLVSVGIGEWLIFAGNQHVGVKILASGSEKAFITTDVA